MFNTDANAKFTVALEAWNSFPHRYWSADSATRQACFTVLENVAKYNDFVPMVYGTGWLGAPVIFARNDGNLTHLEVLLGTGPIDSVMKVVVSGIEIPQGIAGKDMTTTGWYNVVSLGSVQGSFNADFTDDNKQPLGDPHGSIAALSVVVPTASVVALLCPMWKY